MDRKDRVGYHTSIECLKYLNKAMSDQVSGHGFSMNLFYGLKFDKASINSPIAKLKPLPN